MLLQSDLGPRSLIQFPSSREVIFGLVPPAAIVICLSQFFCCLFQKIARALTCIRLFVEVLEKLCILQRVGTEYIKINIFIS